MIARSLVLRLGFGQLVCWGISFYLVGLFGERIRAELGWPAGVMYAGFSGALVVMGLASTRVGMLIDHYGGRRIMCAGSLLLAAGCALMALVHGPVTFALAWAVLGLAMRMTLYDAANAALARIGGPSARGPIAQITLLGGLASTVMWPVGNTIAQAIGWRGALAVYALFGLATFLLHRTIPDGHYAAASSAAHTARPSAPPEARPAPGVVAPVLYAVVMSMAAIFNTAMSSHMIVLLTGIGLGTASAVWISTLRGIGQTCARAGEVVAGARIDPRDLTVVACIFLPAAFLLAMHAGASAVAAGSFAFLFGAGNGLLTITRGTLPIVLFDPRTYGATVGRLLAPSFYLSALAPFLFALLIEHYGPHMAFSVCEGLALAGLVSALALRIAGRRR